MPQTALHGKTVLITGGARRLGRAIALECAQAGASVAITYRTSHESALALSAEVEALGAQCIPVPCDVRSEQSVQQAVATVLAHFGHLDLLVNNAAVYESADLASLSLDSWDRVFETNTRGPFLVAREALPHLQATQGRIVNIGSLGGIRPWATHAHYCASKAALHMLTQTMAKAFAPSVSVNCVAPGFIGFEGQQDGLAQRFAARTPLQRNGSAEDVAQAVLFLATGPSFITGQILAVDGGLGLV
jgi:NAD(P)-dependent dehydrogenase (short-subunit alcohol dehydrogenase family)